MDIPLLLTGYTYSREIIDMFHDLTKLIFGFFMDTVPSKIFLTLHDYSLAWGLPIHTRFDDLDLV